MTSMGPGTVDGAADPAVEAELERLPKLPIVELRRRYQELFGAGASQSVRSGPASAQHRAPDSGAGLWRPLRLGLACARRSLPILSLNA